MLSLETCQKARFSRDPRFDGKFFIAVKTTGIYCRTICPASPPKEENVEYFKNAVQAAEAGYRPCLRCRPDSAPSSAAWQGNGATLNRAVRLIDEGALQTGSIVELATRLGVSDRYLRKLFNEKMGVSPKTYALYQQCLFAKKLLHQTSLPITEIALASGFESIRRFNDCFKQQLKLTPTQMRKQTNKNNAKLTLKLSYRPPFDWQKMQRFLSARLIPGLEWIGENFYGRSFIYQGVKGQFTAHHQAEKHQFLVEISLEDNRVLKPVVSNIRRVLDLDAELEQIEQDLTDALGTNTLISSGLRLPGIWDVFEAGMRAILGQQISVTAAKNLVIKLVETLGEKQANDQEAQCENMLYFPTPEVIAQSDLAFFKMPESRKQTITRFAQFAQNQPVEAQNPDNWLALKGIGPWTANYAKMRGLSDPDIFLATDLGVIKALKAHADFDSEKAAPWRSYLTFQLWDKL